MIEQSVFPLQGVQCKNDGVLLFIFIISTILIFAFINDQKKTND